MCLSVGLSVYLFFMRGHCFELICTTFGMWYPYTLRMVVGGQQAQLEPAYGWRAETRTQLQISSDR